MKEATDAAIKALFILAAIVASFSLFNRNAHTEPLKLKTYQLNQDFVQSYSTAEQGSAAESQTSLQRKLDWVSDTISNRKDLFIQSNEFDQIENDYSFGKRMFSRAIAKQSAKAIQESELKSFYEDVSQFFKRTQNMLSVNEDLSSSGSKIDTNSSRSSGKKLLSLGLDSSNQLSPTITFLEELKLSYEPLNDRILTRIDWQF